MVIQSDLMEKALLFEGALNESEQHKDSAERGNPPSGNAENLSLAEVEKLVDQ